MQPANGPSHPSHSTSAAAAASPTSGVKGSKTQTKTKALKFPTTDVDNDRIPLSRRTFKEGSQTHYPPFTFGKMSTEQATQLLQDKPVGTWLIRYSGQVLKVSYVTVDKSGTKKVEHKNAEKLSEKKGRSMPTFKSLKWVMKEYFKTKAPENLLTPEAFTSSLDARKKSALKAFVNIYAGETGNRSNAIHFGLKAVDRAYEGEVVDLKHRYGSKLKLFQEIWKNSDTLNSLSEWMDLLESGIMSDHDFRALRAADLVGEDRHLSPLPQVEYDSPGVRAKHFMQVEKGLISTPSEGLLNTDQTNYHMFVVNANEQVFIDVYEKERRHHTSLSGGRAVLSAGEMVLENGKLMMISDVSGHYKTTAKELQVAVKILQERGVDLSKTEVSIFSNSAFFEPEVYAAQDFINFGEKDLVLINATPSFRAGADTSRYPDSWGVMGRDEAEKRLQGKPVGSSLIRYSERDKQLIVSAIFPADQSSPVSHIKHVRLLSIHGKKGWDNYPVNLRIKPPKN